MEHSGEAAATLDVLDALARREPVRALVLVAHPDDEVAWLGATLADRDVTLAHATDGAPRDPWFAATAGCEDERALASLRARELQDALAVLGLHRARRLALGARDQEAALELPRLARSVEQALVRLRPQAVIAHAYDGGHPDHDAVAFVARAAIALAARRGVRPTLLDLAGYHAAGEQLTVGFLPRPENVHARVLAFSRTERARKERALACFWSQRDVLARLDTSVERLRAGAREDFGSPPHPGRLHYESHGWALDGREFRRLARRAAGTLGLPVMLP